MAYLFHPLDRPGQQAAFDFILNSQKKYIEEIQVALQEATLILSIEEYPTLHKYFKNTLHTLNTGLHITDAIPADEKEK